VLFTISYDDSLKDIILLSDVCFGSAAAKPIRVGSPEVVGTGRRDSPDSYDTASQSALTGDRSGDDAERGVEGLDHGDEDVQHIGMPPSEHDTDDEGTRRSSEQKSAELTESGAFSAARHASRSFRPRPPVRD